MAKIVFTNGEYVGCEKELLPEDLTIGRGADSGLRINDTSVSSHHARIYFANDTWQIEDLQSANGTMVNGQPISAAILNENDQIIIGDCHFFFVLNGAGAVAFESPQEEVAPLVDAAPPVEVAMPAQIQSAPAQEIPAPVQEAPPATQEEKPKAKEKEAAGPQILKSTDADFKLVEQMAQHMADIRKEVGKIIVGQEDVLNQILMCIIAGGHALLIGLPGLAKTLTVNTIAKVLDMKFSRIQFTPDLMPSDITGTEVLETDRVTQTKEFRFMQGPIFCNMLLADEINRTPPKTQAALLEAMQEKRVSVGKTTYNLDKPFFVLATQNPIEQEGTYPLPEAQLDRFMFNIWIDYPQREEEEEVILRTTQTTKVDLKVVLDREAVIRLQEVTRKIPISPHVIGYVVNLARATRPANAEAPDFIKKYISTGVGPRAGQFLVLAAKARAILEGRIHVSCNDIRAAAIPVMRHRLFTNFAADADGLKPTDIIQKLLAEVKEPTAETYAAVPAAAQAAKKQPPPPAAAAAAPAKKKKLF